MNAIEFIGFIISMIAMIILFFKRAIEKKRHEQNPEFYQELEQKKESQLREFIKAFDLQNYDDDEDDEEVEEDRPPPMKQQNQLSMTEKKSHSPLNLSGNKYSFAGKLEKYHSKTAIENRQLESKIDERYTIKSVIGSHVEEEEVQIDPYAIQSKARTSRSRNILFHSVSKKDLIVINEVIGPPKSLK